MSVIFTNNGLFQLAPFDQEPELEKAIIKVQKELFGHNRIYLDIKKKIGRKDIQQNIPDGYLIDLSSQKPRLYVVENELARHEPLRHIAVQILQFSLAFEAEPRIVRDILFKAITQLPSIQAQCEAYIKINNFRNLDHLLDCLVFEADFAALVIIDEIPEKLENVLASKFTFGVEVLQLARYKNLNNDYCYVFEPFLQDVLADISSNPANEDPKRKLHTSDIDTIVVPAREDGFNEVFLGENRWYQIRIHGSMRKQIKYIAAYQVSPISAITHIASIKSIEPWEDSGKWVVNFAGPAQAIENVTLNKEGRVKAPQSVRYTTRARLLTAKTLDDIW